MGQIRRAAREDRAMNQVTDLFFLDAAVTEHLFRTSVDSHDAVKDAGLRIGVKLDQDFSFGGHIRLTATRSTRSGARTWPRLNRRVSTPNSTARDRNTTFSIFHVRAPLRVL